MGSGDIVLDVAAVLAWVIAIGAGLVGIGWSMLRRLKRMELEDSKIAESKREAPKRLFLNKKE
jgi:hypothetical protein